MGQFGLGQRRREGGAHLHQRMPPQAPLRTTSSSTLNPSRTPLSPEGLRHHHLHQRLSQPPSPRGCVTLLLSLSSRLVWRSLARGDRHRHRHYRRADEIIKATSSRLRDQAVDVFIEPYVWTPRRCCPLLHFTGLDLEDNTSPLV